MIVNPAHVRIWREHQQWHAMETCLCITKESRNEEKNKRYGLFQNESYDDRDLIKSCICNTCPFICFVHFISSHKLANICADQIMLCAIVNTQNMMSGGCDVEEEWGFSSRH